MATAEALNPYDYLYDNLVSPSYEGEIFVIFQTFLSIKLVLMTFPNSLRIPRTMGRTDWRGRLRLLVQSTECLVRKWRTLQASRDMDDRALSGARQLGMTGGLS